nr:unnamed protein product [Callosobruchus analis]
MRAKVESWYQNLVAPTQSRRCLDMTDMLWKTCQAHDVHVRRTRVFGQLTK